jgi:capsular exopolysaccharide synthesis family protein
MSKISKAMDRAKQERAKRAGPGVERDGGRRSMPRPAASRIVFQDVEEYQMLASEIFLALPQSDSRSVMFAASISGEGTSLVAREFAASLAAQGEVETLLVDANLRRPSVHDVFRTARDPGLSDHVLADVPLSDCLKESGVPRLTLLTAGRPVVSPPRVLGHSRMEALLAELRRRFGCVVVDVPPLLPFSDGVQLSRRVDGVVIVIRSGRTKRELIQHGLALLDDAGARVLGSVLNRRRFYIPRFVYDRL